MLKPCRNALLFGDNLQWLPRLNADFVDVIYADPPFSPDRKYGVPLGEAESGQAQAHTNAWELGSEALKWIKELERRGGPLWDFFDLLLKSRIYPSNLTAWMAWQALHLIGCHRVLKSTGSLYLHCDPGTEHLLRMLGEFVFGRNRCTNSIVWPHGQRNGTISRYGRGHDTVLFFTKTDNYTWSNPRIMLDAATLRTRYKDKELNGRRYARMDITGPGTVKGPTGQPWRGRLPPPGRHWAHDPSTLDQMDKDGRIGSSAHDGYFIKKYLDEVRGQPVSDVWDHITDITKAERRDFDGQKPEALLRQILEASSKPGDLVLDTYGGSGTTAFAACDLDRRFILLDVDDEAVSRTKDHLKSRYPKENWDDEKHLLLDGIPFDNVRQAKLLAKLNPISAERWAMKIIFGVEWQGGRLDGGVDGIGIVPDQGQRKKVAFQVACGHSVSPDKLRAFATAMDSQKAVFGVFVTANKVPSGHEWVSLPARLGTANVMGVDYPRLQTISFEDIMAGRRPDLPPTLPAPDLSQGAIISSQIRHYSEQPELACVAG